MDCFSSVAKGGLLLFNTIAVVKSVDIAVLGALMMALHPLLPESLLTSPIVSEDGGTTAEVWQFYHRLALFLLIAAPALFLVACVGLYGVRQKSSAALGLYILLVIVILVLTILAAVLGFPQPLSNPTEKWRPFSNYILASVVCACGLEGVVIFFAMVVISSFSADKKIHPDSTNPKNPAVKTLKFEDRRHSLQ